MLKEAEAGRKIRDLCRAHGISEQTHHRWKAKYGGMGVSEARGLKQLEDENRRLRKLLAEQALNIQVLENINPRRW